MTTLVHERISPAYRRRVLFGSPVRMHERPDGRVCCFAEGAVVAYEIAHGRRCFGCVFRAVSAGDSECLAVPGVRPAVRMLIGFCSGRRFARALALLQELEARGALSELTDAALLRASVALGSAVSTAVLADAICDRQERPWIS